MLHGVVISRMKNSALLWLIMMFGDDQPLSNCGTPAVPDGLLIEYLVKRAPS